MVHRHQRIIHIFFSTSNAFKYLIISSKHCAYIYFKINYATCIIYYMCWVIILKFPYFKSNKTKVIPNQNG